MFEVVCFGYDIHTGFPQPLQDRRIYCDSRDRMNEVYLTELYNPLNFSVQAREYRVVNYAFRDQNYDKRLSITQVMGYLVS